MRRPRQYRRLFGSAITASTPGRWKKGSASGGVHLDKLGSVRRQVKVVAHERATRPKIDPCNFWRPRQYFGLERFELADRFDGLRDLAHRDQIRLREEDRRVGEEMSAVPGQYLAGDDARRCLLHGAPDTRRIDIDTKTFLIEPALQREPIARRGCGRIGHGKIPLISICLNTARKSPSGRPRFRRFVAWRRPATKRPGSTRLK